ncbi:MAG: FAD-dependent oxidoreductase [Gammaproteobacteria bacterium]|nr:FAD-dependent oxidoreductase [Gammaproteobacteria bacterium]
MSRVYDLAVIGGGIHGAGIAQAAAARGHSVLVLEQSGLASGTSSRSSKLIHGGLRYLESGQLALVRECLQERAVLLKIAPDLVRLQPFYISVYPDTSRRPSQLRMGLSLYALLGGMDQAARFHSVPRSKWGDLDGLDTTQLQVVFQYWDGQTDDAALTRAVMRSAQDMGAELSLPSVFTGAEIGEQRCTVHYQHDGRQYICEALALVNAAGPWVNRILDKITPSSSQLGVELVQGTHIVVSGQVTQGIYYVEAPRDRRAVFVMPWQGRVMVGTTETVYHGDPAAVQPLDEEKGYLLETLAHYFPAYRTPGQQTILSAFAGLRVLPAGPGTAFGRPRDTLLHSGLGDRLLSVYGGKLTAYRITAEKVMRQLAPVLPQRRVVADTRELRLI